MQHASSHLDRRRRAHDALAKRLGALGDDEVTALLAEAAGWRANMHGNQSGTIELDGTKVFVKRLSLTDLERRHAGSTANLFGLPVFYQYGIGSAGFGAWRELSACLEASAWALSGECPHFPLVHHWRVLPRPAPPPYPGRAERIDKLVGFWDHSDAVRARLEAIVQASASIVLFIEHAPQTLDDWFKSRLAGGPPDGGFEADILRIHRQLRETATFMNERGMLHFDLNRYNVMTDGEHLYAADFGLALCADFDLSPAERGFFEAHRSYDRCYIDWDFVEWLAPQDDPPALTPALRGLVDRCRPVAAVFKRFLLGALRRDKTAPYPASELEAALAAQAEGR